MIISDNFLLLVINVYLPTNNGSAEPDDSYLETIAELKGLIDSNI